MRSAATFLLGVGTAYFFDPRLGKGRRVVVRDRGAKAVRRMTRTVGKKTRFGAGKAHGIYARSRRLVSSPKARADDATIEQRIRSEAFRDVGVSTGKVHVEVHDGIASLTGSVPEETAASALLARVAKVRGVADVVSKLDVTAGERESEPARPLT